MKKILCFLTICILSLTALFSAMAQEVLYNAIVTRNYPDSTTNVYKEMDKDSAVLANYKPGTKLQVTQIFPKWVEVSLGSKVGYILRNRVDEVVAVDPVNTPPYGVEFYKFYTVITQDTNVMSDKSADSEVLSTMTAGGKLAFIGVEDGWAKLIYHRQYAYVDTRHLDELLPVNQNAEDLSDPEAPIAVFVSFYSNNPGRITNLEVCCSRMNRVMQPGDNMNFNESVGPFTPNNGYQQAPVLVDGETVPGYGGGSCQVSSTLYNTILQLQGITVVERHPHGASGASYLPHGVDASSGALNFRIRNDYGFPIRIDGSCHDFALFIAIYKETN